MKIRLMRQEDVSAAVAIVRQNYSPLFARRATAEFDQMFESAVLAPVYFVAEEEGKILGFAGYQQTWMDYGVFAISWVNVIKTRQREGIGKKLVEKTIREIKKEREAELIILTGAVLEGLHAYYQKNFGFESLMAFGKLDKFRRMMGLLIKKDDASAQ